MSPARDGWAAQPTGAPQEGARIVTTVEYLIDPARAEAFVLLMQESRRARLSEGAIGWQLLSDVRDPARFVEEIVDESWTDGGVLRVVTRRTAVGAFPASGRGRSTSSDSV